MKKILKFLRRGNKDQNNSGMTLVEVLVATTIFALLTSMVAVVFYHSLKQQTEAERWNEQTDMQSAYLSDNRQETAGFTGGSSQYKMQFVFTGKTITADNDVEIYYVDTRYDANNAPTNEEVNIGFFRVS